MSRYVFWAVLASGAPAWLESRTRAIVRSEADEEEGNEPPFEVIPGSGRYHAMVGLDPMDMGAELQIAEELSRECADPIFSIDRANDPWLVVRFRSGVGEVDEVGPEARHFQGHVEGATIAVG